MPQNPQTVARQMLDRPAIGSMTLEVWLESELPKALEYFVRPMPQILKFAAVMQLHALMLRYARHATDRLGD